MDFRQLNEHDRPGFESFRCADRNQWSRRVENIIHNALASALRDDPKHTKAIGAFIDDALVGIIAFDDSDREVWTVLVLAISRDHRRNGIARDLKLELLRIARRQHVLVLASIVHRANSAMNKLNEQLGAIIDVDEHDADYFLCTLTVAVDSR